MNAHFERAFHYADEAFAKADDAFAEASRGFKEAETSRASVDSAHHTVRFVAKTAAERWRLFRVLTKMAGQALFTGKATLKFKADLK
jgi:hypothetical protein